MSASDEVTPAAPDKPTSPFWQWLLISFVFIALIAFAAAHVPGRISVVCRFAPMFGFVVGAVVGLLTGQGRGAGHRGKLVLIAVLAAAGFVGLTLEAHRLYAAKLQKLLDGGIGVNLIPPHMIDKMQQDRAEVIAIRSKFRTYLHYRISANLNSSSKGWSEPWPAVIWSIEILLASVIAALTYHLFTRSPLSPRKRDSFNAAGNEAG
jgi:hypothetical protein